MKLAAEILNQNGEPVPFHVLVGEETPDPNSFLSLDRNVLGRLRRELFWTLGEHRMHAFMARLGLSCGQSDRNAEKEGSLKKVSSDPITKDLFFEAKNSAEALEHSRFFQGPLKSPQCWLLAGYLTGAMSAQNQQPLYFLEVQCIAKGDAVCRFVGKPRSRWTSDDAIRLSAYDEDNMAEELSYTREQLKLTKDRYQNLFEQSSLPIFIIDPDTGVTLDANVAAEELTGYSHEEILKMNVFDFRPTDEHHIAVDDLKSLMSDEPNQNLEMTLVQKDGSLRKVAQFCKVISYGGRSVVQTVMRDITDLKEVERKEKDLQQQLIRSERLSSIGRLAAGVAHELKNPLGAIRNAIYYIKNALVNSPLLQSDPHLKDIIKLAESEVDGSVSIIGELLDFSRVVQLVPRHTRINEILEQLPQRIEVPNNVKINLDLDMMLPSAQVDPDRLKQVFTNIMSNAVQSMPKGGTLTIRSQHQVQAGMGEFITIVFEDTGSGIDPLHLKKIFEPLFTTKARGTGLGLAISNNIIEKHGGVIHVTSQLNKGTTFTIRLPLVAKSEKETKNAE